MPSSETKRRLAAVLMADVEGYSRLMGRREEQTHRAVRDSVAAASAMLPRFGGRFVKSAGDSLLAEFDSALNAVTCAIAIQEQQGQVNLDQPEDQRVVFRMGIHLGDVIDEGHDIFGDCVNIAARVQNEADPGGLCITRQVHDVVANQVAVPLEAAGPRRFKNIDRPIELFHARIGQGGSSRRRPAAAADRGERRVPRLVVLPLGNLSGDPQREYFSDGLTEDVTTNLSRFHGLEVIARASAFAFKGQSVPATDIGSRLDVDYVVEGSVRTGGQRLRVTMMLVDTRSGNEVWAERYDIAEAEIFDLQDEVSRQVAQALAVRIESAERMRALRADPATLRAYGLLLRGHEKFYLYTKPANGQARRLYKRATTLDPSFARVWAALSKTHNVDWRYAWSRQPAASLDHALELAKTAVSLDDLDARGHSELGFTYLYRRQNALSIAEYERARGLNPNDADVIAELADALIYDGRPAESVELFHQAMRLNPLHPDWYYWYLGGALYQLQRYEESIAVLGRMHDATQVSRLLAANHARLGQLDEARAQAARVLQAQPNFTVTYWATTQPFRRREDLEHYMEGLRIAGLQ
jgi:TolB-like protein/class 3 adenylate cyclase/Tfp pilus assembly protein PilF